MNRIKGFSESPMLGFINGLYLFLDEHIDTAMARNKVGKVVHFPIYRTVARALHNGELQGI